MENAGTSRRQRKVYLTLSQPLADGVERYRQRRAIVDPGRNKAIRDLLSLALKREGLLEPAPAQ